MTKLAPEWVRTSDPVIRSPARYCWTTALARKLIDRTPIRTPRLIKKPNMEEIPENPAHAGRKGFKKTAMKHLTNGNYGTLLNILMTRSDKAFDEITRRLGRLIQVELKLYRKEATMPAMVLSLDNVHQLSWPTILTEIQQSMPLVWVALVNILAPTKNPESVGSQVPVLGMIISAALFSRYPTTLKLMPSLFSTMLYKHGNHHAVSTVKQIHKQVKKNIQ